MEISFHDLSDYSQHCLRTLKGGSDKYAAKKLTSTMRERKKYLVHGLNLKFYLSMGLRLKKIHRGIAFHQEQFIRSFIEKCTEKRRTAPTVTEQTLWKLICNSVYGKVRFNFFFSPLQRRS